MPQTRFVIKKTLEFGYTMIIIVNNMAFEVPFDQLVYEREFPRVTFQEVVHNITNQDFNNFKFISSMFMQTSTFFN